MVKQAGALNLILNLLLEIITNTIIVAKYGDILKNGAELKKLSNGTHSGNLKPLPWRCI